MYAVVCSGRVSKRSSLADLVLSVSVGLMSPTRRDSQRTSLMFMELEASRRNSFILLYLGKQWVLSFLFLGLNTFLF